MLKVSIIVPIYNVEKYLKTCLDSIVSQTYENLEIILVDDGSPDKCPQICDEYAAKDQRVTVIHQKNGGISKAREAGIHAATGDYLMTVDGDDWLDPVTVEACVEATKEQNPDCVIFSYVREYPEHSTVSHILDQSTSFFGRKAEEHICRRLFGLIGDELRHPERLESLGSCCMKLYRHDVARKGRYFDTTEVGSSEDTLFNIYALFKCKNVIYIDEPFYHYRKMGNSITSTYRPKLSEQWQRLFEIMEDFIHDHNLNQSYIDALNSRIALSAFGIGMNELSASDPILRRVKKVRQYLKIARYQAAVRSIPIKYMPIPWRILMLLSKHKMAFLVCIELTLVDRIRRKH